MEFPRQEYWSGLPLPSPGDPPNQGLNLRLLNWQVDFFTTEPPWKPQENQKVFHLLQLKILNDDKNNE